MKIGTFARITRIEVDQYWYFPELPGPNWCDPDTASKWVKCPKEYKIIEILFG